MRVFLAFCLVASAFAYPQYVRYDQYPPQEAPRTCTACRANQELIRQSGSPFFQTSDPVIRYDRSVVETPVLVKESPVLVNPQSGGIYQEQTVPVLVKSEPEAIPAVSLIEEIITQELNSSTPGGIYEEQVPVLVKPTPETIPAAPVTVLEELITQEISGPVAERVVMLREEESKRESRSPDDNTVPIMTLSSFDDFLLPVLTDSEDFSRHARSVDESTRVARSAMPEMIPILTNIPAEDINNEMIDSILRSARSLQSTDPIAVPVQQPVAEQPAAEQPVAEQPAAEQPVAEQPAAEQPVAEQPIVEQPAEQPAVPKKVSPAKAPKSFGMYYVQMKSYNYLDDESALKENSVTKTKDQEELQKKYFEQEDKEFLDFMQQLLVQQFTSMLEQQLVQQQDQLKKLLNKELDSELKTTPSVTSTPTPVIAETEVPSSSEKVEVTVESASIPVKGNLEALSEKA